MESIKALKCYICTGGLYINGLAYDLLRQKISYERVLAEEQGGQDYEAKKQNEKLDGKSTLCSNVNRTNVSKWTGCKSSFTGKSKCDTSTGTYKEKQHKKENKNLSI